MGLLTNRFEGISRTAFELLLCEAKEAANANAEKYIRSWATDEYGRYHDPDTQRFWEAQEAKPSMSGGLEEQIAHWEIFADLLIEALGVAAIDTPAPREEVITLRVGERVILSLSKDAVARRQERLISMLANDNIPF